MSQTLANGIVVPTNPDAFSNLTADLATMGNSANVVIPVASQAARDALTKKAGLTVSRTDLPGNPLETCDGTNWATQQVPKVWSTTAAAGSASSLLSNLQSGAVVPIIQCGTNVVTTASNGSASITFPQAFPTVCITVLACNGDEAAAPGYTVQVNEAGVALTGFGFFATIGSTVTPLNGSIRVNWIAFGI